MTDHEALETDIAVVGMSGRFPGAKDVDTLWDRVRAGEDCLTDLSRRDAVKAGADADLSRSPDYVLRAGLIEGVENFDAEFFGFSDRDASIMDPQHRHFIECSWEALEAAAQVPELFDGSIGVFGGAGMNTYLLNNLLTNPKLVEQLGWFLLRHTSNDKDFLTTTVSYKLGLTGPSVNVQTACSTSLVAVHLAAQSLMNYECDLALAGGTTIEFPQGAGYEYREGEILSPTGHCRAFDADSAGTVLTSGVAVVALRRMADAIESGDPILAVVKASAINNDGNRKVSYLAPSVDGHADAVAEALALGDIDPRTIGLLEAHGTGTSIGDPIEVAALTQAFRTGTDETGFCRLTSTKPNIGHLDTAAGGASLIKVVQALRHRTLPPIANHTGPSPLLEIEKTPFVLSDQAEPWESDGPRRAGISSLGVGGTNAHVIVEEAPDLEPSPPAARGQVLAMSANSAEALDEASENLATFLERNPESNLADVANTLVNGRRAMGHRRVIVATDTASAPDELRSRDLRLRRGAEVSESAPKVVFSFPGGGAQYAGMAGGLDERFEEFHAIRSEAVDIARRLGHSDPDALIAATVDDELLQRPTFSLPSVFIASVALARQWIAWGVEPDAMIGHSLGEYVAAHLAGVMSFEDALELVLVRSALMERVSSDQAAMLVVPLPASETASQLDPSLSLAVINAEDEHVVAGPAEAITRLANDLEAKGVEATRIPLAAAAHSSMLDPVLDEFRQAVRKITLHPPSRPYISNLTGDWIAEDEPVDPEYWVRHLRNTVQYHAGLQTVLSAAPSVLVELGPGQSLSSYARRTGLVVDAVPVLRHPKHEVDDVVFTLGAFSQLWLNGVEADIGRFAGTGRRRVTLPTYPFQRRRHWVEPGQGVALASNSEVDLTPRRIEDVNDMGLRPVWQVTARPPAPDTHVTSWIVIGGPLSSGLTTELTDRGCTISTLPDFDHTGDVEQQLDGVNGVILVSDPSAAPEPTLQRWLSQATAVTRALASTGNPARLVALTSGALAARGNASSPLDAAALGPVLVGPKEYDGLSSALVDLDPDATELSNALVADEILYRDGAVAIRGSDRLVSKLDVASIADGLGSGIREGGTYLVTGGLGGVGSVLAAHLAVNHSAGLILTSSVEIPPLEERDQFLRHHASNHPMCRRIRQIQRLEALGGKVETLTVDLTDPVALRAALDEANRSMGPLDGCIHAAGRLRDRPIELATSEDSRFVVEPKALAALVLAEELERRGAELLVLISSTSTELAPEGQTAYVAANAVLDAMAGTTGGLRIATLNYGMWSELGMAAEAADRLKLGLIDGDRIDHPVLSEVSTDRRGVVTASGELRTDHHWLVDEHRTRSGTAILPGTGHIELYLAALAASGDSDVDLIDVILFEPLIVDGPVQVRVVIESDDGGRRSLRIDSDQGTGSDWTTHSEAGVGPRVAGIDQLDVAAVESRCRAQDLDPIAATASHLDLGPRWSSTVEAGLGDGEASAILELGVDDGPGWLAHPALVDIATGVGVQLADQGRDLLHVPVGYDRVVSLARLPNRCAVHAQLLASNDPDVARIDLTIADGDGAIVLRIDGLQLRALADATLLADTSVPTSVNATASGATGGLLELTNELGLRPEEGTRWFDSLVAGPDNRLIASSVDLEDLREFARSDEPEPGPAGAESAPVDPASGIDAALLVIWQELLGVNEIGMDDDFFDLGGHSLIAIRLMARIKREFSVRLELTTLFEAPTVATLAELIAAQRPDLTTSGEAEAAPQSSSSSRHLVVINGNGTQRPIYIVHGAGGNVMFLLSLSRALGRDYPLFGFQALGINEGEIPDSTVEAMAKRYVAELRERAPGPYVLGGYSGGGVVALEMVKLLQAEGDQVERVILFDSVPSGKALPGRKARWIAITKHALRHGPSAVKPYIRRQFLSQLHRVIPEPGHRLAHRDNQERELGMQDTGESGFINLFDYFSATANRYKPGRYAVDATVLKADHIWPSQPRDYHWSRHIDGRLDWRVVPGDHHTMFYPGNAPALSDQVKATLETLGPPPTPKEDEQTEAE